MIIVGEKITKVDAKRGKLKRGLKIETKPEITKISSKEIFAAGEKRNGALIDFNFNISYEKSGHINLKGSLFVTGEDDELKRLQKEWKKDKKINDNIFPALLNRIFELGLITAIPLSKTLGLPVPLQLPRVNTKQ